MTLGWFFVFTMNLLCGKGLDVWDTTFFGCLKLLNDFVWWSGFWIMSACPLKDFNMFLCKCEINFWMSMCDGWCLADFLWFCVIVDLFCVVFVWWSGFRMTFERFFCDVYWNFCRVFQQFVWFCVMEWFLNHVGIIVEWLLNSCAWWNGFEWFLNHFCVMELYSAWMNFEWFCFLRKSWKCPAMAKIKNIFNPNPNSTTIATSSPNKIIQKCWEVFNVKTMRIQRELWMWKLLSSTNVKNLRQDISRNGMAGVTSLCRVIPHHAPSKRSLRWPEHEAS